MVFRNHGKEGGDGMAHAGKALVGGVIFVILLSSLPSVVLYFSHGKANLNMEPRDYKNAITTTPQCGVAVDNFNPNNKQQVYECNTVAMIGLDNAVSGAQAWFVFYLIMFFIAAGFTAYGCLGIFKHQQQPLMMK